MLELEKNNVEVGKTEFTKLLAKLNTTSTENEESKCVIGKLDAEAEKLRYIFALLFRFMIWF